MVPTLDISITITIGPIASAGAILISASIGAIAAYFTVRANRQIARRRATMDLYVRHIWDSDYQDARNQLRQLRAQGDVERYAETSHRVAPQANAIRDILNDYEALAISIRADVIDEAIYHRLFRGVLIDDWELLTPYVRKLQELEHNKRIYCETEALCARWKDSGFEARLKKKRQNKWLKRGSSTNQSHEAAASE